MTMVVDEFKKKQGAFKTPKKIIALLKQNSIFYYQNYFFATI
jgi:hypothetical protein